MWIQPLQKHLYLWVLCAMQCVHEDPDFIPKSLKCAVQDFSPFLQIQPGTRQCSQRQHAWPGQTLQHMTSLDSVTDPRCYWSLFSFHYTLLSLEGFIFLPAPPQGCSSAGLPPSQRAEGSCWSLQGRSCQLAVLHCALVQLLQQAPSVGRGLHAAQGNRYHDFSQ